MKQKHNYNTHQLKYEQTALVSHYLTFFLIGATVAFYKIFKGKKFLNNGTLYLSDD